MKFLPLALLGAALALASAARLQADEPDSGRQVLAFERARCDAAVAGDAAHMADMLADDLTYTHAAGYSQTKKEYVADVASGALRYHSIDLLDRTVKLYGNVAVTHGIFRFTVNSHGNELKGDAYYSAVYVSEGGKCRLVSWQSTRIQGK